MQWEPALPEDSQSEKRCFSILCMFYNISSPLGTNRYGWMFFFHPFWYFLVAIPHSSPRITPAGAVDAFFCLHSSRIFLLPSLLWLVCLHGNYGNIATPKSYKKQRKQFKCQRAGAEKYRRRRVSYCTFFDMQKAPDQNPGLGRKPFSFCLLCRITHNLHNWTFPFH